MKKSGKPLRTLWREVPLDGTLKTIQEENKEQKKKKARKIDCGEDQSLSSSFKGFIEATISEEDF